MSENIPEKEGGELRTGVQCLGAYERHVCPVVFNYAGTQLAKPSAEQLGVLHRVRALKSEVAAINGTEPPEGSSRKEKHDWALKGWTLFTDRLRQAGLYQYPDNDPEYHGGSIQPQAESRPGDADQHEADPIGAELESLMAEVDAMPAPSPSAGREEGGPPVEHGALYVPDLSPFTGREYFATDPEPYDWLLLDSFARGQLGAFIGPPGAGKGTLSIQLCVAAAAGVSWFGLGSWQITRPGKALFVSAEDDRKTIHRRIRYALQRLPENRRQIALDNIVGVPVCGNVSLCENTAAGFHKNAVNIADLDALLSTVKPELLILDTLSRFFAIPENANELMTQACGVLEEVCRKHAVTPILIHHAGKGIGSDLVSNDAELKTALSQHAARGATALAGAVRWMFNVAPLQKDYAATILGENATDYTSGHYLAVKVSKKNIGAPESEKYLERGDDGICSLVEPEKKISLEEQEKGYLERLVEEVTRRAEKGEPPLRKSDGARFVLQVGKEKATAITSRAIYEGKLVAVKKGKGNGELLALPGDAENGGQEA